MNKNIKAFICTAASFMLFMALLCLVKGITQNSNEFQNANLENYVIGNENEDYANENGYENNNEKKSEVNKFDISWKKGNIEIYQSTSSGEIECYLGSSTENCAENFVVQNAQNLEIKDNRTSESIKIVIPKNIYINSLNIYANNCEVYVHAIRLNTLHIETQNGEVRLSGVTTDENIEITTQNGNLTSKGCNSVFFSMRSQRGNISVEGYSREYYLSSKIGSINFTPVLLGERCDLVSLKGNIYAQFGEKESFCLYVECNDDNLVIDRGIIYSLSNSCYVYNEGTSSIVNVECEKGRVEIGIR